MRSGVNSDGSDNLGGNEKFLAEVKQAADIQRIALKKLKSLSF